MKMNDGAETSFGTHKSKYHEYRERVIGTTIDNRTLLSTDYFNSFNEVVMLLGMVADMPEVIEDIHAWKFHTYQEHFLESGLPFAALAIEAYAQSPPEIRERFEKVILELRRAIVEVNRMLTPATNESEKKELELTAATYSKYLQGLIESGSGIVHTANARIDQATIDAMF
jgi:hypothetical protein